MNKLRELIDKYCPNGVEYKPLGDKDVSIMQRGTSLTKKDSTEGIYPVISGGKTPETSKLSCIIRPLSSATWEPKTRKSVQRYCFFLI